MHEGIGIGWPRSYRKHILQITQPSQNRYAKLQYRFAVTSGSPDMYYLFCIQTFPPPPLKILSIFFLFHYFVYISIFPSFFTLHMEWQLASYSSALPLLDKIWFGFRSLEGGPYAPLPLPKFRNVYQDRRSNGKLDGFYARKSAYIY